MKRNYLPAVLPIRSLPVSRVGAVLGSRNITTREGYQLDLWYVSHRTFWLDLLIVVWTPLYMLFGFSLPGDCVSGVKEIADVGPLFTRGERRGGGFLEISVVQPLYLPWLGFFEMIAASDAYVSFRSC